MTDKILLKRSLTSGSIPTTSSLEVGELAINVHDATVYLKQSGSAQEVIRPLLTLDTDSIGEVLLTGSITVTDDVTAPNFIGDLHGTASFALTASYAESATVFPFIGDAEITGSLSISGSFIDFANTTGITGSVFTGSFVGNGSGLTGVTTTIEEVSTFAEEFTTQTIINIFHNLNTTSPIIQVYDGEGAQVIPEVVKIVDNNNIRVEFPVSASGKVVVAKGGHILTEFTGDYSGSFTGSFVGDGSGLTGVIAEIQEIAAFALDFTDEEIIDVVHGLNTTAPIVQVYDDENDQIIPEGIRIIDENTVRVTFPIPASGKVVVGKAGHVISPNISGSSVTIGASAADVLSAADGEITADDAGSDKIVFWDDSESKLTYLTIGNGVEISGSTITAQDWFVIAASDETTNLTTATGSVYFRMPYAGTLLDVRSSVNTAPSGSTLIVDINESGTSVLSTKLSIDATEKTSTTAAVPPVISDSALADDAEMSIDIDQVGSTIAGKGLKVYLKIRRN